MSGSNTSLLLAINHADTAIRRIATAHLVSAIQAGDALATDVDFVTTALIGRLQDDDSTVVHTALKLGEVSL